ncbi:MAG: hypothetical protein VKJ24_15925 [Synechococcales bacterium]|nr:hypothetical protein [Synechococcales bacterium]
MGAKLTVIGSAIVVAIASFPLAAQAQDRAMPIFRPQETPDEAMEREYFDHAKSILNSQDFSSARTFGTVFGVPGFPENLIIRDNKSVHRLYRYLVEQQANRDPVLRSADLNNPFNVSIQTLPASSRGRISSGELIFDRVPAAAPAPTPAEPIAEPTNPTPAPDPSSNERQPVEAKF